MSELRTRCAALIDELGIASPAAITAVVPLTGGVASDIARVDVDGQSLCIKFALPKLKVAADWYAPMHRNAAEYAWLETAASVCPEASVRLFGRSLDHHGFAMEYLDGPDVYLWKTALLNEVADQGEAALVGDMLGRVHAASVAERFERTAFQNRDDFHALRIEPYLSFTARAHPDVADVLNGLADMLHASEQVLVHGDVSPKNILLRPAGPVLLDAECATMGDASFDPAFCLNHLVLKAAYLPASRDRLLASTGTFWTAYAAHVTWEDPAVLEERVCRLLPALMLARIDGKSPVEYLGEPERETVRRVAKALLADPASKLAPFVSRLRDCLEEQGT